MKSLETEQQQQPQPPPKHPESSASLEVQHLPEPGVVSTAAVAAPAAQVVRDFSASDRRESTSSESTTGLSSGSAERPEWTPASAWSSLLGWLPWAKAEQEQSSLVKMFEQGKDVCAVCASSEDESGYFIGKVTQVETDNESQVVLKLTKMAPLQPEREGLHGCQYYCTSEVYYVKATELQHIPMQVAHCEERLHKDQTTDQVFTLDQHVLGGLNDTVSVASVESLSRNTPTYGSTLKVLQLQKHKKKVVPIPVDLDSPADIESVCRQLVDSLSNAIDGRPAFATDDCEVPPSVNPVDVGWKWVLEKNGIKVYQRNCPDTRFYSFMAQVVLDASPFETKFLVKQSSNRGKFDEMCRRIGVVQTIDENTVVVNFVDTKFLLNRDFCIMRHDHTMKNGTVFLASNSVETPKCPRKEHIRGEAFDSGFKLEPQGKGSCLMTYITNCDLKLWAPSMFLEVIIRAQLLSVCATIRENLAKKRYTSSLNQTEPNEGR